MTFVKVDTGLMQALINNLNDRAEAVEDERSSIYITSMNNSDGLEPPVEEAHDLAGHAMTAVGITLASNHQDDFMSLYLNFVSLMNVSNASRVSSKSARWMLLMEFLASFQTCSMGFLSGL